MKMKEDRYSTFTALLVALGLDPIQEFRFCERRWRFDYAFPHATPKVALEIEGGIWVGQGHARPAMIERDIAKYNEAAILGWVVIRATPDDVASGQALRWLSRALEIRKDASKSHPERGARSD